MTAQDVHRKVTKQPSRPCALLWDESLVWGLMARRALTDAGLPFDIVTAVDIRRGKLKRYRMIFIPGGWASDKLEALGKEGRENIRQFVEKGGSYLGICGGAGMATEDGLGLLPVVRKPAAERVPSFSGGIRLACKEHAVWNGIDTPDFHAWWPSQLQIAAGDADVLAVYESPGIDAFTADIAVEYGEAIGWPELEHSYGILMDPARLRGEPAVIAGHYGHGKVILSLIHFDTPGDRNGAIVLRNIWRHLSSYVPSHHQENRELPTSEPTTKPSPEIFRTTEEIREAVEGFADFGVRNFLWHRRNPLLLQWRRGVRGMEYSTLIAMIREILVYVTMPHHNRDRVSNRQPGHMTELQMKEALADIKEKLIPFIEKAKRLLVRERLYMQSSPLSPLNSGDEEINRLRKELFASAMSHGGDFKCLIDAVDRLLLRLIKETGTIQHLPAGKPSD
jgi:hypothetical protein